MPSTFDGTSAVGRVFCDSGPLRIRANSVRSIYHGLQGRFDVRNLANQLTGGISYQWGKSIDNVSEIFTFTEAGSLAFSQNPFDFVDGERGVSNFDLTHNFAAHFIWDSPFMREQQGVLGKALGGWQVNGQLFLFSGRPYTPLQIFNNANNRLCGRDAAFNTAFIGTFNTCRPFLADQNAPVNTVGFIGDPGVRWWVPQCDAAGCPLGPFGVGRNTVEGPTTELLNMSLFKNTRFGPEGRFNFQVRWSMVNVLNNRNFGVPDVFIDDSFALSGLSFEDSNFALADRNDAAGRVNRLALRFTF